MAGRPQRVNSPPPPSSPSAPDFIEPTIISHNGLSGMPASQHTDPKSDIEIAQSAKKRPIVEVARERLGMAAENLEPYGHYKAKASMDYIKTLPDRPDGKLI